jgi:hypothetical protein
LFYAAKPGFATNRNELSHKNANRAISSGAQITLLRQLIGIIIDIVRQ